MSFLLLGLETLLAPFAALGVVLAFLISRRRRVLGSLASELPERFGSLSDAGRVRLMGRRVWWLHAASAGEVSGLAPLIDALAARPDAPAVLVTTMTVAGREAARRNPRIDWAQLAPLDAWPCVARFLGQIHAERLIVSETELWPTLLLLAARAGLKPALINARMTERSLPRYRAAAFVLRPALDAFDAILAQSGPDADRFRAVGAADAVIAVTGNTKYDRAPARRDDAAATGALVKLGWADAPLFVAGSTHPVEEDAVLEAFARCAGSRPKLRLVIAPRHAERAHETAAAMKAAGRAVIRLTELDALPVADADILVVDAMGALPGFWPKAAAAFVGGTLVPVGGHNLLEPASAGVPVLFGPHTGNIDYPASVLEAGGGGFRVKDADALAAALEALLGSPANARNAGDKALASAESLRGATRRTLDALERPRD
ncbi:MAG: 3-deoxy-D-manno-octulosonic acid transferase [Elusimicrobiota bacterium]